MTEEATVIGNYHSPIEREAGRLSDFGVCTNRFFKEIWLY